MQIPCFFKLAVFFQPAKQLLQWQCKTSSIHLYGYVSTSRAHLEGVPIFHTNGTTGHCSKSKCHRWKWTKVLLYRWPVLMSSVCTSLMFAVSRKPTARHFVPSNENDNNTWKITRCTYGNQSFGHTVVYCYGFMRKLKVCSCLQSDNNMSTFPSHLLPHCSTVSIEHVNINHFSLGRLYSW